MKRALLILALCAGMLAPGLAGGQRKTPLEVCLDGGRDWAAWADACRTAAEQEDPKAQNNLGVMYNKGLGVPQDNAEAMRWYRRAAEQGDAGAQNNLGNMYNKGLGVPADYVRAHMWYNLAVSQVVGKLLYNSPSLRQGS